MTAQRSSPPVGSVETIPQARRWKEAFYPPELRGMVVSTALPFASLCATQTAWCAPEFSDSLTRTRATFNAPLKIWDLRGQFLVSYRSDTGRYGKIKGSREECSEFSSEDGMHTALQSCPYLNGREDEGPISKPIITPKTEKVKFFRSHFARSS